MQSSKPIKNDTITSGSTQNLWCRDTYWQNIIDTYGFNPFKETNGCHLRKCQFEGSKCRGAHRECDIKPLPHILSYNKINKAKFDWVKLYLAVIKSLSEDKPKVKDVEHQRQLDNITSIDFIQAINLWRDMACIYRKLAKEILPKSENPVQRHSSGFMYSDEVPRFKLPSDLEDVAWSFERLTRHCPVQQKFIRAIESNTKITVWDLCLATGINCKEGTHKPSEMICKSDFLTGKCSCPTTAQMEESEARLQQSVIELTKNLTDLITQESQVKDDGWSKPKKSRKPVCDPKVAIRQEIAKINKQIEALQESRPIHYSEQGMIPFEEQYKTFQENEEIRIKEEQEKAAKNPAKKESWNHDLVDKKEITKPVVKLVKLGAKK